MKDKAPIFTLLILLLFACKRELPVQLRQTPAFNYAIHLFGIVNADTLFADSAQVAIDGESAGVADSHGVFVVHSITPGVHDLSVIHKLFSNYDSACRFEEIHDIYLPLVVPLTDFFPLNIGATWVYRCNSAFYLEGVQTVPSMAGTGTIIWTVLSSESNPSADTFSCRGVFVPDSLTFYGWSSDTAYFNPIESSNHRITFSTSNSNSNWFMYSELHDILINYHTLYRYQPANGPDTLVLSGLFGPFSSTYTIAVRKGIGIYRYEFKLVTPPSIYRYLWTLER
jgi:hypothetical protein